jgi:hypothetical protein
MAGGSEDTEESPPASLNDRPDEVLEAPAGEEGKEDV